MTKMALILTIGLFVALLFVVGFSQPADAQVLYGCYVTKDGTGLRIVTDQSQCKKNETFISLYTKGNVDALVDALQKSDAALQSADTALQNRVAALEAQLSTYVEDHVNSPL